MLSFFIFNKQNVCNYFTYWLLGDILYLTARGKVEFDRGVG